VIKIARSIETHNNICNPELAEGWRHFVLTLKSERTLMTFNFSTSGDEAPQVEEAIEHLQDLTDAVEHAESVEDWAAEYGLDPNLSSVHKRYAWAQSIAKDFRHLQSGEEVSS
jgi:hypothetical protein